MIYIYRGLIEIYWGNKWDVDWFYIILIFYFLGGYIYFWFKKLGNDIELYLIIVSLKINILGGYFYFKELLV